MSRIECPSKAWDRYCDSMEEPEECPSCGKPNAEEEGEPLNEAFPYCCAACEAKADEDARLQAEAEAKWDQAMREADDLWAVEEMRREAQIEDIERAV